MAESPLNVKKVLERESGCLQPCLFLDILTAALLVSCSGPGLEIASWGAGGKALDFSLCRKIMDNVSQVIVGQERSIELLLVALLAEGHVLIEDVPGLGKTVMATQNPIEPEDNRAPHPTAGGDL